MHESLSSFEEKAQGRNKKSASFDPFRLPGKGKILRCRKYSLGYRKPFQGEVEQYTNGAIPSKLSQPQGFFSPKPHGPLNPRAAFTRKTNLVLKRDLGWEATVNYTARSRIIKYGCHWDKVNFEAVLTDVPSRHTLF